MQPVLLAACSAAALLSLPSSGQAPAKNTVEGNWVGGAQVGARYVFLRGKIERKNNQFSAIIDAPIENQTASTESIGTEETLSLQLPLDGKSLRFKARGEPNRLAGVVARADGTQVGHAVLRRWAPMDAKDLALYSGAYGVDPKRIITIQAGRFALYYYDGGTGRYGIAYPSSRTEFFGGTGALRFDQIDMQLSFLTDSEGRATELRLTEGHLPPVKGPRTIAFATEDVVVDNRDVRLGATLRVPRGQNQRLGIVLIHGSGPQDRNGFNGGLRIHADEFARRGISVLTYDKRGVGASTGRYDGSTYEEFAADALAMVRYLKARGDLGLTRIGVWGISQGGQIAPMVAAREPSLAFVANTSGTVTNPEEQEIYRTAAQLRAEGLDAATIRDGVTLQILKFYYARTGFGWDSYFDYYERFHRAPWFEQIIGSPASKDSTAWAFWRAINAIEPSEFWRQVRAPCLVVFGGLDRLSPVDRSIALFRLAMSTAANQRFEIKIFPNATHDMQEDPTGAANEMTDLQRYQPGYFDYLAGWILGK